MSNNDLINNMNPLIMPTSDNVPHMSPLNMQNNDMVHNISSMKVQKVKIENLKLEIPQEDQPKEYNLPNKPFLPQGFNEIQFQFSPYQGIHAMMQQTDSRFRLSRWLKSYPTKYSSIPSSRRYSTTN